MAKIWINKTAVADYRRVQGRTTALAYQPAATAGDSICVAMPFRPEPYTPLAGAGRDRQLFPFFAMSLPEGGFRQRLDALLRQRLPNYDDMTLLEIVGHSTIGRVRVLRDTATVEPEPPSFDVADLLKQHGGRELFDDLFERFTSSAGVSGAQPKLLIHDKMSAAQKRLTVKEATHILKTFDPREHPHLAANEYLCLLAAKKAGMPVPDVHLSADGSLLAVERFDILPDGKFLGFEDVCSLEMLHPEDKYSGSYEQVARTLLTTLRRAPERLLEGMENFFKNVVLSVTLRNGDAHRKNFGLLYDSPVSANCLLAPAYDVVTTTCYLKNDRLALMFNGSKNWPGKKALIAFGERCLLSKSQSEKAIETVCDAVADTRRNTLKGAVPLPDSSIAGLKEMFAAWESGLRSFSSEAL
ncbi:MAG: type II toxin-antitoxin system HipA family toxin [Puniceicoccales bacterium]|jgi:serine/threonine-protein kinase HipA|nr:type II toxin-antitoxin system HipA family toxin [Puniceicoccales bacterium]